MTVDSVDRLLILDLGSGTNPNLMDGMDIIHLDMAEGPHVEIVANLNNGIPVPSNIFDRVLAVDVLEHVNNVIFVMDEIHRVLKPDGVVFVRGPVFGSPNHVTDPTHQRGFTIQSFDFFDDTTELGGGHGKMYTKRRWNIDKSEYTSGGQDVAFIMTALKPNEEPSKWGLNSNPTK